MLLEAPFMLFVMVAAARWTIRRLRVPICDQDKAAMSLLGFELLVVAQAVGVWWIRRLSWVDYVVSVNLVTASVTVLNVLLFAAMPLVIERNE